MFSVMYAMSRSNPPSWCNTHGCRSASNALHHNPHKTPRRCTCQTAMPPIPCSASTQLGGQMRRTPAGGGSCLAQNMARPSSCPPSQARSTASQGGRPSGPSASSLHHTDHPTRSAGPRTQSPTWCTADPPATRTKSPVPGTSACSGTPDAWPSAERSSQHSSTSP
jgi:hypothetical protein